MLKNPPIYKSTPYLFLLNPYPPIYIAPSLLPTAHSSSCTLQEISKEKHFSVWVHCYQPAPDTPTCAPKAGANPTNCCTGLSVGTERCRRVFPAQWEGNPRRSWVCPRELHRIRNIPWDTPQSSASLLYLYCKLRTGTLIVIFLDMLHWNPALMFQSHAS